MNILERFGIKLPPLPSTPPTHDPHRSTLLQLAIIIGLAVLAHFQIADPLVAGIALIIYILKLGLIIRGVKAPNRIVMMLLTIFSLVLIIALYGGWNGQRAGISFLVLLVTLKFLESRGLRDYFVVCLILYFLSASSFLFDSSILSISIVLLYTLAITSILFQLANPTFYNFFIPLKASVALVAKAVPLSILLFFFFPRIQGDFGFLPSQDRLGNDSELSNSLVAGDLATSAFNNTLAFRVEFDGEIPATQDLYWRAKVMSTERNFQWEVVRPNVQEFDQSRTLQAEMDLNAGQIKYEILHEKSTDLFLPYLDYVAGIERGQVLHNYSVFQNNLSSASFKYRGASNLASPLNNVVPDFGRLLFIERNPTARTQALLARWREAARSEAELVLLVYQHFANNPFRYSLTPDSLEDVAPLDDFLFRTQVGYCEHYASAFTTLMRWLNIPARVVVGYQGGKAVGNDFLEVKYSDAHAWSEVWVEGRWQRIDPTAAISPERIEYGMDAWMELWNSNSLGSNAAGLALSEFLNPTGTALLMKRLSDTWSSIGYQWNKWIVDYDFDKQRELLSNLGFKDQNSAYTLVTLMMAGVGSLILFYFWQLIPKSIRRSEVQAAYLKFVRRFKKHRLIKEPSDSPSEFARKAIRKFPQQRKQIAEITQLYQSIRYGKEGDEHPKRIAQLKRLIKQFKIG